MPNLLNKIDDLSKRIFVNRAASGSLRLQIERKFSQELQRGLIRLDKALSERLVSEGILRSMQQQARLISRLPYKQRKPAISDTLNSVFNPGNFRDLKFTDEVRGLANIYRKYAPLMYDMGAVTALRSFGIKAQSRQLNDFSRRYTASKAPMDLVFELTDEEVIWMLDNRGIQFGQGITEQTIRDARAIIREEVYLKGNSYQAAADRIAKMNGVTPARSLKIARTEAQVAHSTATHDQYVRSGVQRHQWWAVGDRRTRPEHAANSGTTVKVGQPFPNGQIHPGEGPSSINCRCVVTPDLSDKNIQLDPWRGGPGGTPSSLPGPGGFVPRTITPAERLALREKYKPKPRPKRKPKKKPKPKEAAAAKEAQDFEKMRQSIIAEMEKDPDFATYVSSRDEYRRLKKIRSRNQKDMIRWFDEARANPTDEALQARLMKKIEKAQDALEDIEDAFEDALEKYKELQEKFAAKARKMLRTEGRGINANLNTKTGGYDNLYTEDRLGRPKKRKVKNTTKALQGRIDEAVQFIDDVSSARAANTSPVTAAEQTAAKATADDIAKTLKKLDEHVKESERLIKAAKDQGVSIGSRATNAHRHNKVAQQILRGELEYYESLAKGQRALKQQNFMRPSMRAGEVEVRAFHSTSRVAKHEVDILVLADNDPASIIVHELVHGIENHFHARTSRAFLKHRVGGPGMNLADAKIIQRGSGLHREIMMPDEFLNEYQGKLYFNVKNGRFQLADDVLATHGTEINTMYMQTLYEDPILLMQHDPEGFVYIMETMNGVPLEQQTWFRALSPERRQWVTSHLDDLLTPDLATLDVSHGPALAPY